MERPFVSIVKYCVWFKNHKINGWVEFSYLASSTLLYSNRDTCVHSGNPLTQAVKRLGF